MCAYVGEEASAYYIEEATFGTTPSPATNMLYIGVIQDIEPRLDPKNKVVRGLGSRNAQSLRRMVREVDLNLAYVPRDWDFWAYLANDKSISLEVIYNKDPTFITLLHKGLKIDKAQIAGSIDDVVKITIDAMAQTLTTGTAKIGANYESAPAAEPITGLDCVIKKGGVEVTRFSDFSFDIANNLKRQPVIRSTTPYLVKALPRRQLSLSGSITADFESKAELDNILADDSFTLAFEVGAGAQKKTFTFSNCKWRHAGTPTKVEDLVAQKLEWDALSYAES